MSDVKTWAPRAPDNNEPPPNGWPENMNYRDVNNAARELMAAIFREYCDRSGTLVTTGTADALAIAPYVPRAANVTGDRISARLHRAVNAGVTLTVGGGQAAPIEDARGSAVAAGSLSAGDILDLVFVTDGWRIQGVTNPANTGLDLAAVDARIAGYARVAPAGRMAVAQLPVEAVITLAAGNANRIDQIQRISAAAHAALVTAGTVDANTAYLIPV